MKEGDRIAVECEGGPFDGHQDVVTLKREGFDMYLFVREGVVHGYGWLGCKSLDGKRWLVSYVCEVGVRPAGSGKGKGEEV